MPRVVISFLLPRFNFDYHYRRLICSNLSSIISSHLFQGLSKGGKKGIKKKVVDPFTRKDWYDVRAPSIFKVREVGKTLVNRTQGTRIASDGLKGRVYEVSLADLQNETVRMATASSLASRPAKRSFPQPPILILLHFGMVVITPILIRLFV